jgi:hypothetical protein
MGRRIVFAVRRELAMNFRATSRSDFARHILVVLGLALAVFTWGLQYKLSLYDLPHTNSEQIPTAKLLSQNERPTPLESLLTVQEKAPRKTICALFSVVFFLLIVAPEQMVPTVRRSIRGIDRPWIQHSFSALHPFFFRPPPVFS